MKITASLIKADVGVFHGYASVHPVLMETAKKELEKAKKEQDYGGISRPCCRCSRRFDIIGI